MTDDVMRDLVAKHDNTLVEYGLSIKNLITSVEHLVSSQTETNKRLEEISKYLAKQAVFSSKLDALDKDLADSFKRIHKRIDEVDAIQKNEHGCNSVRLLTKDVESITRDMSRFVGTVEEHRIIIEHQSKVIGSYPSTGAIRWGIGILVFAAIAFGSYTVESISMLSTTEAKIDTILKRTVKDMDKLIIIEKRD